MVHFRAAVLAPAFMSGWTIPHQREPGPFTVFLAALALAMESTVKLHELLEPSHRSVLGVMLTLIVDIRDHPRKIFRTKTNHAVANLPLEHFVVCAGLLIDIVRRATFELPYPIAGSQRWRYRYGNMNMRFDSADLMDKRTGGVDDALSQRAIDDRFHGGCQQRRTVFCMPNHVEIDFTVVVARHEG